MGKYYLDMLEIDLNNNCNLRCAGCSHFSSLVTAETKQLYDLNIFDSDLKKVSEIFSVNTVVITGGEPFLIPNLLTYIQIINSNLPTSKIIITSNGILVDRIKEFHEKCKKCDVNVKLKVSAYPIGISNIYANTVDKSEMRNINLNIKGTSDKYKARNICMARDCVHIYNSRIYRCPVMRNICTFEKYFNINLNIPQDKKSISIYSDPSDIIDFLSNFDRSLDLCRYCSDKPHRMYSWHKSNQDISEWIDLNN